VRADATSSQASLEARVADLTAELMAARTDAEQAHKGLAGLREELSGLREYAATARAEATAALDAATAARQEKTADDRRYDELRTEIAAVMASVREFKHGFEDARQAAVAARRDADAARAAAERAGTVHEETTEKFTEVWREMLNLAPKPRTGSGVRSGSGVRPGSGVLRPGSGVIMRRPAPKRPEAPLRPARAGFDDQTRPMAVLDLRGRFTQLNPSFTKLVGYGEHEFGKAAWPSVLDRKIYKTQMAEFERLIAGEVETAEVQSSYMHSQGLMVPVEGEIRLVRGSDGKPDHLLLVVDAAP
jgi:PAS domain S-box-containing protein